MAKTVPVNFGGVELSVEVMAVAGSEQTSRATRAIEGVIDVVDELRDAIVGVATSMATAVEKARAQVTQPDHVEVAFGVKISASGNVIVAGLAAESTLTVKLVYDAKPATSP
jgi:hypothetical protein